jgi:multidrug efflux system membrane fusion protein
MKTSRNQAFAAVLSSFLFLIFHACARAGAQPANAPPPPRVDVAAVISRDVVEWDEFTGRLEAVHAVAIRPRVSGYVTGIGFQEGTVVRKGDLLFEIDARPFKTEVDRLRAEVARANATVQRATTELERANRLSSEEAMTQEEHDRRASFAKESAAQVAAVEAALRAAELNLEFTHVTSPIDGRVGRAIVTAGNLVSAGPPEATLLTTVVSLDPIYASFEADEQTFQSYVDLARQGKRATARAIGVPVRMALANEEGFPHEGTLDFLDNHIDPATGTIRGRGIFRNHDLALTPGSFVRLQLPGGAGHHCVLIQDRAIGTDLDKRFVYAVAPDSTVQYRAVELGPIVNGLRVVRSGLKAGDVIVVNGLQHVRPGAHIDPAKGSMEALSASTEVSGGASAAGK